MTVREIAVIFEAALRTVGDPLYVCVAWAPPACLKQLAYKSANVFSSLTILVDKHKIHIRYFK